MIKIISVGKIKDKALKSLIDDYVKRIGPFSSIELIEVKDFNTKDEENESLIKIVKEKEAELILSKIKDTDFVCLMDLHGKEYDSLQFSKSLENKQMISKNIVYVIAGSYGYGESVYKRANEKICLSKLTFPHQIVRLLLVEQIYRAYKIINNHSYHK